MSASIGTRTVICGMSSQATAPTRGTDVAPPGPPQLAWEANDQKNQSPAFSITVWPSACESFIGSRGLVLMKTTCTSDRCSGTITTRAVTLRNSTLSAEAAAAVASTAVDTAAPTMTFRLSRNARLFRPSLSQDTLRGSRAKEQLNSPSSLNLSRAALLGGEQKRWIDRLGLVARGRRVADLEVNLGLRRRAALAG